MGSQCNFIDHTRGPFGDYVIAKTALRGSVAAIRNLLPSAFPSAYGPTICKCCSHLTSFRPVSVKAVNRYCNRHFERVISGRRIVWGPGRLHAFCVELISTHLDSINTRALVVGRPG